MSVAHFSPSVRLPSESRSYIFSDLFPSRDLSVSSSPPLNTSLTPFPCLLHLFLFFPSSYLSDIVVVILRIFSEIPQFILVLTIIVIAFLFASWVTTNVNPSNLTGHLFEAGYDFLLYVLGRSFSNNDVTTEGPVFIAIITIFRAIVLILMTILIAFMNGIFAEGREQHVVLWRKERAKMILDHTLQFPMRFPELVVVFKYASEVQKLPINLAQELAKIADERNIRLPEPNQKSEKDDVSMSKE